MKQQLRPFVLNQCMADGHFKNGYGSDDSSDFDSKDLNINPNEKSVFFDKLLAGVIRKSDPEEKLNKLTTIPAKTTKSQMKSNKKKK